MLVREVTTRKFRDRAPRQMRIPADVLTLPPVKRIALAKKEHVIVLILNTQREVEVVETISIGSLNAAIVHPREVFHPAIVNHAATIILVHNHPAGDPEPSPDDVEMAKRLVAAGDILGIPFIDSVIVARRGLVSLRMRKLMPEVPDDPSDNPDPQIKNE